MLRIEHLGFAIGSKPILNDITVQYAPCQIHGIIGPNGAGKSTLLRNVCRIWEPRAGTIYLDNQDYRQLSRRELSKRITMVPQNTHISFPITIYDVVAMGRNPHLGRFQTLTAKDRRVIDRALELSQIKALQERNINEVSGGELQLAVIARALATEAAILLLDEPTSDLDIRHILDIMELLEQLKREGKTILINLHDLNSAARYCDTITILHNGGLYFKGTAAQALTEAHMREVFGVHMTELCDAPNRSLYFFTLNDRIQSVESS